jgi:uncharacterized membrane protein HdeD (DUF308 family)
LPTAADPFIAALNGRPTSVAKRGADAPQTSFKRRSRPASPQQLGEQSWGSDRLGRLSSLAFGILLIGWPAVSLTVLILLFGAFALIDGALILAMGLQMPSGEAARPAAFIAGALAVIVGIATFLWPGLTEVVLLVLIALRAIIVGIAEMVSRLRGSAGMPRWHGCSPVWDSYRSRSARYFLGIRDPAYWRWCG